MRQILLFTALLTILPSCSQESSGSGEDAGSLALTAAQEAGIADTVEVLAGAFWDAWATPDVDRGMALLAEDATAVTKTAAILRGRETIDAAWRPMFTEITGQVIDFSDSFVSVYGPNLASVHQMGTFLVSRSDGTTEGPIPFTFTTVWLKRDNRWQIIVSHRTDPPSSPSSD